MFASMTFFLCSLSDFADPCDRVSVWLQEIGYPSSMMDVQTQLTLSAEGLSYKSRKGFQTKNSLCEAAFTRISTHGIASLSVAALCDDIGLARSSLYTHFPDLDALIESVSDIVLGRIGEMSSNRMRHGPHDLMCEERLKFVLSLPTRHPNLAVVLSELHTNHESTRDECERRLRSDVLTDITDKKLSIDKRESIYFARMCVATALTSVRHRIRDPKARANHSAILRLLFHSVKF